MYQRSDMVYSDYKWTARADHDNPKIISGTDHTELNRTEGYEMLYFIRSLVKTWGWNTSDINRARGIERAIRTRVPGNIRSHSGLKQWLEQNP